MLQRYPFQKNDKVSDMTTYKILGDGSTLSPAGYGADITWDGHFLLESIETQTRFIRRLIFSDG